MNDLQDNWKVTYEGRIMATYPSRWEATQFAAWLDPAAQVLPL